MTEAGAGPGGEEQLVVFELAGEAYGLPIAVVREIITLQPVTRVPRTPPFVEGVTNLRGRVVPVLDLRRRLGLGVGPRDRRTRIVIVEGEGGTVGVVVDAVTEVRAVPRSAVQPPSPYVARGIDAVRGIAELGDRLLVLLDLARILDAGEEPAEAAGGEGPDLAEVS